MSTTLALSDDQATAYDRVTDMLAGAGINLTDALLLPPGSGKQTTMAVTGKAGSGKTLLLSELTKALGDAGLDIVERKITRDELYIADEVFMCGTAAEVTPVREIDQRRIGSGSPGEVARMVQDRYMATVRGAVPEYAAWLHRV